MYGKQMPNYIEPFWDIEEIYALAYEIPPDATRGFNLVNELDRQRYSDILTTNIYRGSLPPCLNGINNHFSELNNRVYAIHQMLPGSVLPYHVDKYSYYMESNNISSVDNIVRIIVFLEDWKPGHLLEVNGNITVGWQAGNYISWSGSTKHMAANLGYNNRYTLQITGYM